MVDDLNFILVYAALLLPQRALDLVLNDVRFLVVPFRWLLKGLGLISRQTAYLRGAGARHEILVSYLHFNVLRVVRLLRVHILTLLPTENG